VPTEEVLSILAVLLCLVTVLQFPTADIANRIRLIYADLGRISDRRRLSPDEHRPVSPPTEDVVVYLGQSFSDPAALLRGTAAGNCILGGSRIFRSFLSFFLFSYLYTHTQQQMATAINTFRNLRGVILRVSQRSYS
jgi:hypothetical protein